ncbi:glycosyltransferase [Gynuella sp.]|uniref:glycosyltransferase n=1 Tax=Gynuella sp. TaxID=2969146 RepID=UPI003D12162D
MNVACIYRHQVGKTSESFIYTPLRYFNNFNPIVVGTEYLNEYVDNYLHYVPERFSAFDKFFHRLSYKNEAVDKWFLKNKPNIIHAHFAIDGLYAAYYAKKHDIPLVVTLHGFDVTRTRRRMLLSRNLSWIKYFFHQSELIDTCSKFICVSDFIYRMALQAGFPEDKLVTHYIGVDTSLFAATPRERTFEQPFTLFHLARLTEKKGTIYLLRALHKLNNPKINLIIGGDGPLSNKLKRETDAMGLSRSVKFLGQITYQEVQNIMSQSDALCVPSISANDGDSEGLGMVFLEAAISGLPVVATNHGGIPEAVINDETGYLVPEKDVDILAEKINSLYVDPETYRRLSLNAVEHVKQKFDVLKNTEKLEQIYQNIIAGRQ